LKKLKDRYIPFIGFELNKEYYEKSLERINTEKAMLTLF